MTKIKQTEHFQTRIHTFCLLMPTGDFSLPYIVQSEMTCVGLSFNLLFGPEVYATSQLVIESPAFLRELNSRKKGVCLKQTTALPLTLIPCTLENWELCVVLVSSSCLHRTDLWEPFPRVSALSPAWWWNEDVRFHWESSLVAIFLTVA